MRDDTDELLGSEDTGGKQAPDFFLLKMQVAVHLVGRQTLAQDRRTGGAPAIQPVIAIVAQAVRVSGADLLPDLVVPAAVTGFHDQAGVAFHVPGDADAWRDAGPVDETCPLGPHLAGEKRNRGERVGIAVEIRIEAVGDEVGAVLLLRRPPVRMLDSETGIDGHPARQDELVLYVSGIDHVLVLCIGRSGVQCDVERHGAGKRQAGRRAAEAKQQIVGNHVPALRPALLPVDAGLELVRSAEESGDEVAEARFQIPVVATVEPATRAIPCAVLQAAPDVVVTVDLRRIERAQRERVVFDDLHLPALCFEDRLAPENGRPLHAEQLWQPVPACATPGDRSGSRRPGFDGSIHRRW